MIWSKSDIMGHLFQIFLCYILPVSYSFFMSTLFIFLRLGFLQLSAPNSTTCSALSKCGRICPADSAQKRGKVVFAVVLIDNFFRNSEYELGHTNI